MPTTKTQPNQQVTLDTLRSTGWDFAVALFYNYVVIDEPTLLCDSIRSQMTQKGLTGRAIIATEGINITCGGTTESVAQFCEWLQSDPRFTDTHFKFSKGTGSDFPKISVKVRNELVTLRLGNEDFHPRDFTGKRLTPMELHSWYEMNKDFIIVDMRNVYEHEIGHFVGSVLPPLQNFRDLSEELDSLKDYKDKTVLTVCTGGVRCEKASGYLAKKGFADVYQLDGGMVSYMEQYPGQNFLGSMYTFDNRQVITWDDGERSVIAKCSYCQSACERLANCCDVTCNNRIIVCESCVPEKTTALCTNCKNTLNS